MYLNNYTLQNNTNDIILHFTNGKSNTIHTDEHSGKLVYRQKESTLFGVQHTGIYIGKDTYGNSFVAHSHIDTGQAVLDPAENFSKGEIIFVENQECVNSPFKIIEKALGKILSGIQYTVLVDNCQHLTSDVCNNVKGSPDLQRVSTSIVSLSVGATMIRSKDGFMKGLGVVAILFGIYEATRKPYNGTEAFFI